MFPVQYRTFKHIYNRTDMVVRDLTGSGKTLAFGIPIIENLRHNKLLNNKKTKALILAPTRELAIQISKTIEALKHNKDEFDVLSIYGGRQFKE